MGRSLGGCRSLLDLASFLDLVLEVPLEAEREAGHQHRRAHQQRDHDGADGDPLGPARRGVWSANRMACKAQPASVKPSKGISIQLVWSSWPSCCTRWMP